MDLKPTHRFDNRAILGLVLLLFGGLLLAENLRWLSFDILNVVFSLPFLAMFLGIIIVIRRSNNIFGYILLIVGALFVCLRVLNIPYDFPRVFWSIVLISVGVTILFQNKHHSRHAFKHHHWHDSEKWKNHENWFVKSEYSSDEIDEINVFGGCERRFTSRNFKGGKITAIFGGAVYDMRDCELAEGVNVLDIVNIFGGTKLIIPSHWKVNIEVASIFGGFSDKRTNIVIDESGNKELHLVGVVIFGGGEIKSY